VVAKGVLRKSREGAVCSCEELSYEKTRKGRKEKTDSEQEWRGGPLASENCARIPSSLEEEESGDKRGKGLRGKRKKISARGRRSDRQASLFRGERRQMGEKEEAHGLLGAGVGRKAN